MRGSPEFSEIQSSAVVMCQDRGASNAFLHLKSGMQLTHRISLRTWNQSRMHTAF